LSDAVRSFGVSQLYGWEFFDPPEASFERWRDRLSLDVVLHEGSHEHCLYLFKEASMGPDRHLDLVLWFGGFAAHDYHWHPLSLTELAAGAKRWWSALHSADPRTQGHGIVPAGPSPPRPSLRALPDEDE
jgi:hypothetical protein